jgi:hypothetical protein
MPLWLSKLIKIVVFVWSHHEEIEKLVYAAKVARKREAAEAQEEVKS